MLALQSALEAHSQVKDASARQLWPRLGCVRAPAVRFIAALIPVLVAAQAAACAQLPPPTAPVHGPPADARWSVANQGSSGPVMTRTIAPVTLYFRVTVDEYNLFTPTLTINVADCGAKPWSRIESVNSEGETTLARAADVREVISKELRDAAAHCKLPDDIATRLLEGFDAAYAEFEALKR